MGVAVYDDRVEVTSTGTLHFDLTVDALFRPHESLPWNPLIAHVFYLRGIVEQWGRGIQQMVDLMAHAGLPKPQIEEGPGSVTVRFSAAGYVAPTRVGQDLTPLQRAILEVLAAKGSLPPGEIVGELPARVFASKATDPLRQTREALFQLRSYGLIEQRGHGRGSRWCIALTSPNLAFSDLFDPYVTVSTEPRPGRCRGCHRRLETGTVVSASLAPLRP